MTETGQPTKTTLYLGGMVYEDDVLQFIGHEEGRLRYAKKYFLNGDSAYQYIYDYFIKDHLGNVRMVLTEQKDTAHYMATMEAAYRAKEEQLFENIEQSNYAASLVPGGYPTDPNGTNPNDSLIRVNGSDNKTGPSLVLKVMSGDVVDIGVKSFYRPTGSAGSNSNPVNDILNALAGGIVGIAGEAKGTLSELNNTSTSPLLGALNSFLSANNPNTPSGKPKAYLNWILLDEQFNYTEASSGAIVVGDADELETLATSGIPITKNGFLYIYVSNETQNWNVFFDNLAVMHYTGPVVEETHYYPFGGIMAGISSKALKPNYAENKYKFNKGSELQNKEFSDGSGLEWYATKFRMYDPQIGRWHVVDPKPNDMISLYAGMENNPILKNDPLGDTTVPWPARVGANAIGNTAKGFVFGLNQRYQTEPAKTSTVTGIRDTKGATNASGKTRPKNIVRVDGPHVGAPDPHLNVNPKATGVPDPHTKLTPGQFNGLKTTGQLLDGIDKVAKPVAVVTDAIQIGSAIKTDIEQGTGGDNTIVATSRVAGGWAGAWIGAKGGGATGAGIGSFFGPVGTGVGGLLGSIIGGISGAFIGSEAGEAAGKKIVEIKNE